MGCLLPWCILKRAIIFPLRLHFTRQINQLLTQQPLLVSAWAPCSRDQANRPRKATAFSRAAWWHDRSRTSWSLLPHKVDDKIWFTGNYYHIYHYLFFSFFNLLTSLFWFLYYNAIALALLVPWQSRGLQPGSVLGPSVPAGSSHNAKREHCLLRREGKGRHCPTETRLQCITTKEESGCKTTKPVQHGNKLHTTKKYRQHYMDLSFG